jgi:hypothetical protein
MTRLFPTVHDAVMFAQYKMHDEHRSIRSKDVFYSSTVPLQNIDEEESVENSRREEYEMMPEIHFDTDINNDSLPADLSTDNHHVKSSDEDAEIQSRDEIIK